MRKSGSNLAQINPSRSRAHVFSGTFYSTNLADGVTIYYGTRSGATPTTNAQQSLFVARRAMMIKEVAIVNMNTGGSGTNEASTLYIRVNNTTDYLVTAALLHNAAVNTKVVTGLAIPLAVSDTWEFKQVNATWATNPLGTYAYYEAFAE